MNIVSSYKSGIFYERIAKFFLLCKMYKILFQRYKTYAGEIDIIARKGGSIIFVEVKYRSKLNFNYETVTGKQINRIKKAASLYISSNENLYQNFDIRFDLIIISNYFLINHLKNIW